MHMYAPYSLVRAALENASAAVWLLHPDDRAERILRRLRFAALDIRNGEEARRLVGAPAGPKSEAERIEQICGLAQRRGVDEAAVVAKRPVSYREIVKSAANTRRGGETAYMITWKMCSGIAHGDMWTTINVVSREELPGAPPDIAHLKITAKVETLMLGVYFAVDMTDAGWGLYDERSRRSAPNRPRPKRP
jgi:hypothetical protein